MRRWEIRHHDSATRSHERLSLAFPGPNGRRERRWPAKSREPADRCACPSGQEGVLTTPESEGPRLQCKTLPVIERVEGGGLHVRSLRQTPELVGRSETPEFAFGDPGFSRVGGQQHTMVAAEQIPHVAGQLAGRRWHDD
jgi:hypothetical protein